MKICIFMSNNFDFSQEIQKSSYKDLSLIINYDYSIHNEYEFIYYKPYLLNSNENNNCLNKKNGMIKNKKWSEILSGKKVMTEEVEYFVFISENGIFKDKNFKIEEIIEKDKEKDIIFMNKSRNISKDFYICKVSDKMRSFFEKWYDLKDMENDLAGLLKDEEINYGLIQENLFLENANLLKFCGDNENKYDYFIKYIANNGINYKELAKEIKKNEKVYNTREEVKIEKKISILIGTPCFGAQVSCNYTKSLIKVKEICEKIEIDFEICFVANQLTTRARNLIAHEFLKGNYTHLVFIDADIDFNPIDVINLVNNNKDICVGLYANKGYHFDKNKVINRGDLLKNINYSSIFLKDSKKDNNNLMEIKYGATGFMSIKRKVFEELLLSTEYYLSNGEKIYDFFPCKVEDKEYLTEDYYFCKKWREKGGRVWSDLKICLNHEGWHSYHGNPMISFMKTNGDNL
jgi:hypothetical protein